MGRIYPKSILFVDSQVKKDSNLVNWVKLWPIIFDKTNPLYFDKEEREKIWEIIAAKLGTTAQICKERWRMLIDAYENYKNGYLTIHEILFRQLEECLNIARYDIKQNTRETLYTSSKSFCEIREEVQSFSLISQQHGSLSEGGGGEDYDVNEGAASLLRREIEFDVQKNNVLLASGQVENDHFYNMNMLVNLESFEQSSKPESPISDISQEQHANSFLEHFERGI